MTEEYEVRSTCGRIMSGFRGGRTFQKIVEFTNIHLRTVYNMIKIYDADPSFSTLAREVHKGRSGQFIT